MHAEIYIPKSKDRGPVLVDLEDMPFVMRNRWGFDPYGYLRLNSGRVRILLHQILLGPENPKQPMIDHKNGNILDNRRSNLRLCSHGENRQNTGKYTPYKCSSKHKGVYWSKKAEKWEAAISCDGARFWLGYFDNEKDAAIAYNNAASRHHGRFARLNVID